MPPTALLLPVVPETRLVLAFPKPPSVLPVPGVSVTPVLLAFPVVLKDKAVHRASVAQAALQSPKALTITAVLAASAAPTASVAPAAGKSPKAHTITVVLAAAAALPTVRREKDRARHQEKVRGRKKILLKTKNIYTQNC